MNCIICDQETNYKALTICDNCYHRYTGDEFMDILTARRNREIKASEDKSNYTIKPQTER